MVECGIYFEMSQRPESKFYQKLKQELPELILTRLENWAVMGTPDVLSYNKRGTFCTIELKVVRSKKISISPHQIAFAVQHPINHFYLIAVGSPRSPKLYESKAIHDLLSLGIETPNALACDWNAVRLCLYNL
jgi:hypothetical protein